MRRVRSTLAEEGKRSITAARLPRADNRLGVFSKEAEAMPEIAKITIEVAGGIGTIVAEPRQFKTGSRGFYGQGKVQGTDGRRYQIAVNVVEIGSKPTTEK